MHFLSNIYPYVAPPPPLCRAERGQHTQACQWNAGRQSGTHYTLRPELSPKATMP